MGFGFSGSAACFIGHKKLCSALASLEVQFNKNWGLNYIQLKGDAAFMVLDDKLKALSAVLKDNIEKTKLKGMLFARTKQEISGSTVGMLSRKYGRILTQQ